MSTITYIVKVASGKFTIDDAVAPKLTFRDGDTYVFDQADNSNSGHILQFSATSNNSGSSEYTTGVTKTGTAGSSGAKTTIVTSGSTTDTLYYYSSGGGDHGAEFSNSGFNTSTNYSFLKPIIGGANTAEKWGSMVNHAIDQIDQNISGQDLDGATDSGTVAVDLDTQSLTVAGSNGIATSGSGQTITISGEALAYQGEPHIIPNVLYPAVAGKLLDGSTSHGATYGVAQSDGRSYYYTDIKGSKPIKDPRIGGHFGSQRHKFKSLQLLEQETATHGNDVFSIDGREWCRAYSTGGGWLVEHASAGTCITSFTDCTGCFLEITGYFNDINFLIYTGTNRCDDIDISVNGTLSVDGSSHGRTTVGSPLDARYVDAQSAINTGSTLQTSLGTTPKINTIRYEMKTGSGEYVPIGGIELIAQDTTSTANKSKIQIPSQNVVSYGKKFTISGTPHYDPFNGMSGAKTLAQLGDYIDTATSLGMDNWKGGTSNYYKPFNGGRVVKWVDSSGTIKTSVTMMPPNAQNIAAQAVDNYSDAEVQAGTNNHAITFDTTTIANATPLSELAKSFHWREFGNGGANATGGLGTSLTYADFSMLTTNADYAAYSMDDGLTSMQGEVNGDHLDTGDWYAGGGNSVWITFIGTGIGFQDDGIGSSAEIANGTYAQNLAYGSHILRLERSSPYDLWVDGFHISTAALVSSDFIGGKFIDFHQPKMPPISEDAVIIADYMLMADFVLQNGHNTAHDTKVSKGVRIVNPSRDVFYDEQSGFSGNLYDDGSWPGMGFRASSNTSSGQTANKYSIPAFGTTFIVEGFDGDDRNDCFIDDSDVAQDTNSTNNNVHGDIVTPNSAVELGLHKFAVHGISGGANSPYLSRNGFHIVTPIHTSYHYQTFETPYLHELVGGDRNMEQHNLIVTPDGKTWDEVTRDTSYIGNMVVSITTNTTHADGATVIFDEIRGSIGTYRGLGTKDWTIANNRLVCLKVGQYEAIIVCNEDDTGYTTILLNGTNQVHGYQAAGEVKNKSFSYSFFAKRGDYLQLKGHYGHDTNLFNNFQIKRL